MGCSLVVLMAPSGQLRQPQLLVRELSHCGAPQGCLKFFLLLSSGLKGEWMGGDPTPVFFGGGKVKVGDEQESWESFYLTYTAVGCFSSRCLGA